MSEFRYARAGKHSACAQALRSPRFKELAPTLTSDFGCFLAWVAAEKADFALSSRLRRTCGNPCVYDHVLYLEQLRTSWSGCGCKRGHCGLERLIKPWPARIQYQRLSPLPPNRNSTLRALGFPPHLLPSVNERVPDGRTPPVLTCPMQRLIEALDADIFRQFSEQYPKRRGCDDGLSMAELPALPPGTSRSLCEDDLDLVAEALRSGKRPPKLSLLDNAALTWRPPLVAVPPSPPPVDSATCSAETLAAASNPFASQPNISLQGFDCRRNCAVVLAAARKRQMKEHLERRVAWEEQRLRDQLACLRAKQNTVRAGPFPHLDLPSFPIRWMPMAGTERSQEGQACQAWYRGRRWLEVSQACGA